MRIGFYALILQFDRVGTRLVVNYYLGSQETTCPQECLPSPMLARKWSALPLRLSFPFRI
jgi:hypothetical protein